MTHPSNWSSADGQSSDWQFHTVQAFLQRCNWLGYAPSPPMEAVPPAASDPPLETTQPWQCQTVATFFRRHNWSGLGAVPEVVIPQPPPAVPIAPLTRTVGDYLAAMPWEGQPLIGALPPRPPQPKPPAEDALNVSDLSSLF